MKRLSHYLKNISLSTHYFIFACGLIFIIAIFSLMIASADYRNYEKVQQQNLQIVADLLNDTLTSIFNTTYQVELSIGKQITEHGPNDNDYIYSIFKRYAEIKDDTQNFYSWSLYDWVNADKKLVVDTKTGIQDIDISTRKYLQEDRSEPWKLQISDPLIGYHSGERIIVASTGITNSQGKFFGSIVVGINLNKLENELERTAHLQQTSFVIYRNGYIIAASHENFFIDNKLNLPDRLFSQNEGDLTKSIKKGDIVYSYYRRVKNYPDVIILTGVNSHFIHYQFSSIVLPHLLGFIGTGLMCLILIVLFHYWFIKPVKKLSEQALSLAKGNADFKPPYPRSREVINLIKGLLQVKRYLQIMQRAKQQLCVSNQALTKTNIELHAKKEELQVLYHKLEDAMKIAKKSDAAKQQFIRQIRSDMKIPLLVILKNTQFLITWLQKSPEVHYLQVAHINYLEQILAAILQLKTFTPTILQLALIDVKIIISESLLIHKKSALDKDVKLKFLSDCKLPLIYADELRLKQVLVELLSRAIESTPAGREINISCKCISENKKDRKHIKIVIEDTGFGLSDADYQRIKKNFSIIEGIEEVNLELDAIRRIVELHQGKFYIRNEWNQGTQAIILLPFINQEVA